MRTSFIRFFHFFKWNIFGFFAIILLFPFSLSSQPKGGGAELSLTYLTSTELKTQNPNINIHYDTVLVSGGLAVPLVLTPQESFILNHLAYSYYEFTSKERESNLKSLDLHSLSFTSRYIRLLNNRWAVVTGIGFNLGSDFDHELMDKDWQPLGMFALNYKFDPTQNLTFGATYTTKLGEEMPLPILQYRLERGNIFFHLGFPPLLSFFYGFSKMIHIGFIAESQGTPFYTTSLTKKAELYYTALTAGPTIRLYFSKGISLHLSSGLVWQRFSARSFQDSATWDMKRASYIRFAINYNPRKSM